MGNQRGQLFITYFISYCSLANQLNNKVVKNGQIYTI